MKSSDESKILTRSEDVALGIFEDESGQTAIEYILVIALAVVALVLVYLTAGLDGVITSAVDYICSQLPQGCG